MDEAATLAALRSRDEGAFRALVESWTPLMTHVARAHVSTDASAEEVVQDTWVGVLRGIDAFEGRSSLRTWTFRILTNIAKTRGVREHRMVPQVSADPTAEPDRLVEVAETAAVVQAAIALLPERQRAVITLRDVYGFPSEEVCELLDLSSANQRVLLHRARAAVRAVLDA